MANTSPPPGDNKFTLSNDTRWDQSARAEAVLQHILEDAGDGVIAGPQGAPMAEDRITVKEAIFTRPVLDQDSGRNKARVLFVTTDERALSEGSSLRHYYSAIAKHLDEVHVFCLVPRQGEDSIDRTESNLWFYQVRAKSWWRLPWVAKGAASDALTWNGSARPDVVVGVNLFEAGLAAYLIAWNFGRPVQYHINIDPFGEGFRSGADDNLWRRRIAKFLLKRAKSLRVATTLIKESLTSRYRRISDVAVLPRFYDFSSTASAAPSFSLHEKYPDYSFLMLAYGKMTADSELHDLFSALNWILKNPRVGLILVGDGPGLKLFKDKVKILGIEKNVVFLKEVEDTVSYLKTADLMIELERDEESEIRVLRAAMAGAPLLLSATDLRRDLFKDGESAFLCDPDDVACVSQKTSKFLNSSVYRTKFSENAAYVASTRINENPDTHYETIALSIESALVNQAK